MSALEHADTDPLSSKHLHIVDNVAFEEDDNWEDEDDYIRPKVVPWLYPRHPPHDGAGNPFVTIVHTNGYHSLPVVWCMCPAHLEDRDLQMLRLDLYPATYDNIKTVMSFSLLEHQWLDNLECKTSIYQYHQKLQRLTLTCPDCLNTAPNRYAEGYPDNGEIWNIAYGFKCGRTGKWSRGRWVFFVQHVCSLEWICLWIGRRTKPNIRSLFIDFYIFILVDLVYSDLVINKVSSRMEISKPTI